VRRSTPRWAHGKNAPATSADTQGDKLRVALTFLFVYNLMNGFRSFAVLALKKAFSPFEGKNETEKRR
jgi:hypothetical protein